MSNVLYNNGEYCIVSGDRDIRIIEYSKIPYKSEERVATTNVTQTKFLIKNYGLDGVIKIWESANRA